MMSDERIGILESIKCQLIDYISKNSKFNIEERLRKGLYVYGAGNYGRKLVKLLVSSGFQCSGFIDAHSGRVVDQLPVFSLTEISKDVIRDQVFVLGIHKPDVDVRPILENARLKGFSDFVMLADLIEVLGTEADNFWLSSRSSLIDNFDKIIDIGTQLSDQLSFDLFCNLIKFRAMSNYEFEDEFNSADQYVPKFLPAFTKPITLVDGGAYTGDTYTQFIKVGIAIDKWIAFEPDLVNFVKLTEFAETINTTSILFPCALSNKTHIASFQSDGNTSSKILDEGNGNDRIICLPLDKVLTGIRPDCIKLDVEGAEMDAILGMQQTIRTSRPRMYVSVYHKPEDLWEIPIKLRELLPDSSIYLRQHGYNGFETVLYIVPDTI